MTFGKYTTAMVSQDAKDIVSWHLMGLYYASSLGLLRSMVAIVRWGSLSVLRLEIKLDLMKVDVRFYLPCSYASVYMVTKVDEVV